MPDDLKKRFAAFTEENLTDQTPKVTKPKSKAKTRNEYTEPEPEPRVRPKGTATWASNPQSGGWLVRAGASFKAGDWVEVRNRRGQATFVFLDELFDPKEHLWYWSAAEAVQTYSDVLDDDDDDEQSEDEVIQ